MKTRCRFLCFSYNSSEEIKYDFRFFSFLSQTLQSYSFQSLFLVCNTLFAETATWSDFHLGKESPSQDRLTGWDCAACSACRRWENAVLTCMNVPQTSPYFSSPVLTEKQKVKQPDVHTHTHTRRKLGNADNKFNLHSWTNRGLCHLCTITSLPLSQSQSLSHTLHCATRMLMNTQTAAPETARRNADFPTD